MFCDQIGLLLFGSPSRGSEWAVRLSPLSRSYGNRAGRILRAGSAELEDLHREFLDLLGRKDLDIVGQEFSEHYFVVHRRWWPLRFRTVVSDVSAANYFPHAYTIPGTDHFTLVAPKDRDAAPHRELKGFLLENGFVIGRGGSAPAPPSPSPADRQRR